jgi:hypothetical protein
VSARYEVTGKGYLPSDGSPWDGRGHGQRLPWLWLALLTYWSRHIQFPSSPAHSSWRWNIYDHEGGTWIFEPTQEG